MNKKERLLQIEKLIIAQGSIQIATLCRMFHICEMSARRDLEELQKRNILIRTHGGAIAMEKKTFDAPTPLRKRLKYAIDEKEAIAQCARNLIKKDDTIFLGSGSTIDVFANTLMYYVPLTILSDALNIASKLYVDPHLHIILTGGELRSNSLTLTGHLTQQNIQQFQLKRAFIGINGMDEQGNLYVSSIVESGILEVLFQHVEEIYVLADSSKIKRKDLVKIQATKSFTLITSSKVDINLRKQLESYGISILLAT